MSEDEIINILDSTYENWYERMFEVVHAGYDEDISIHHQHKSSQLQQSGSVIFDNGIIVEYESGINNGSVVLGYSTDKEFSIPKQMQRIMKYVPTKKPEEWSSKERAIYTNKSKLDEFAEMARKQAYDDYFGPSLIVDRHYAEYREKWNLEIDHDEIEVG